MLAVSGIENCILKKKLFGSASLTTDEGMELNLSNIMCFVWSRITSVICVVLNQRSY